MPTDPKTTFLSLQWPEGCAYLSKSSGLFSTCHAKHCVCFPETNAYVVPRNAWCAAYRAAFVALALSRGWERDDAEEWAVEIEDDAACAYWPDTTPEAGAAKDVPECEQESDNAC